MKSKNVDYVMIAILAIATMMIAGCTSEASQSKIVDVGFIPPASQPTIQVATPLPTIVVLTDDGSQTGWVKRTNTKLSFTIYTPKGWNVETFYYESNPRAIGDSMVGIYSPQLDGFVLIYGVDTSNTIYGAFVNPDQKIITDEFYDGFIQGIKSGATDVFEITTIVPDHTHYNLNGNPARKFTLHSVAYNTVLSGEGWIVMKEKKVYCLIYMGIIKEYATPDQSRETASTIMNTFRI